MRLTCAKIARTTIVTFGISCCSIGLSAMPDYQESINAHQSQFEKVALDLWNFAELGYQETQSSTLLQAELKEEGFTVTSGIADIPTAFKAEYGTGGPVIGDLLLVFWESLTRSQVSPKASHRSKRRLIMQPVLDRPAGTTYLALGQPGRQWRSKNG